MLYFLFWLMLATLFYTFAGYGLILYLLVRIKLWFKPKKKIVEPFEYEPEVCLFVTAYNEKEYVDQKVANSFSLDYPRDKVQYIWITDGSDDGTPELLKKYPGLEVYHQPARKGKIDAMNRGMQYVKAPIVIFSDTNTRLSYNTIRDMVACFADSGGGLCRRRKTDC
jgi:cellulose synthase/poly-beta-1,6-N-acetylglucosamine synthase-like glycosyltransferase